MIAELVKLITAHSPRRFAGYVVFCLLAVLTAASAGAATIRFHAGGGKINGQDLYPTSAYSVGSTLNIADLNLTLTHSDPTYFCEGWYWEGYQTKICGPTGSFVIPAEDMDLYARWIQDTFLVVFDKNGGSGTMADETMVATVPKSLTKCTFTRTGYHFLGWSCSSTDKIPTYQDQQSVTWDHDHPERDSDGNVRLYAVWEEDPFQYTVMFDPGDHGTGSMSSIVMTAGESRYLPLCSFTPSTGYKFRVWNGGGSEYTDGALVQDLVHKGSGNAITLTAQWTYITYHIAFNANGGTGEMAVMDYRYGENKNLTVCSFARTGYAFAGWATSATGPKVYDDHQAVKNLTTEDGKVINLFAIWTPIRYLVRFDAAGGSGEMADMECEYDKGYSLTPNAFSRVGGSFLGWTTNSTRTVFFEDRATISNLSSVANSTNVMKAVWSNIVYHIAFDGNGGSGSVPKMDCEYGTVYQLPSNAFAKTGYLFSGWTTNSTSAAVYTEGASVSNLTLTADATLTMFAAWRPITYRVTFDPNGGEGEMVPMTNTYDIAYTLTSNSFTKLGRSFAGWATNASGSVVYNDGASVSNLVTVDDGEYPLFAVWQKAVNDLNAALDNDQLTILKDPGELPYLTVVSEPTATNGTCVKINRDAKNDGTLGFRVYLDAPGELKFNWKVVNVYPGWHNDGWTVKVHFEEPEQTNDVLYVHRDSDYEDPEMEDWEKVCVSVTNCPASLQFIFTGLSGNGSTDLYALFDFVRWSSGGHPEPTPEDAPVISGAATAEGGRFRITFPADARFKYELIKTESLAPVDWKSFAPQMFISPDTSGNVSFEPEMKAAEPQMFYRVKVLKKD